MHTSLQGHRVLITGVGIRPVERTFIDVTTGKPTHISVQFDHREHKANIGACVALSCAKANAVVHIVGRTEEKLRCVKNWIEDTVPNAKIDFTPTDLNDREALQQLCERLPADLPLDWVQSAGLGAGTVQIKDDNPYMTIEHISEELMDAELSVLKNTIKLFKVLLPRFRRQEETRVCIVSSMSAVRSIWSGSIHNAAKGAISRFTNAAMLELDPERIYITDVRPGAVDTGLYDSPAVLKTIHEITKRYGYDYDVDNPRLMPPTAVGETIANILSSEAHITSINLVARGQIPHEAS